MINSLRQRLLLYLLPSIVVVWILAITLSYLDIKRESEQIYDAQIVQLGRALLSMSLHEVVEQQLLTDAAQPDSDIIQNYFPGFNNEYETQIIFQVWLHEDNLALRSENAPTLPLTSIKDGFSTTIIDDQEWRIYSLSSDNQILNAQIGLEQAVLTNISTSMLIRMTIPMLISLPFLGLLVWVSVNQSLAPVKSVAGYMRRRKTNDLSPIDEKRTPLEIQPVFESINDMFAQMKTAFDTERRFTSDAAHELRTPLAALKTHAEIALQAKNIEEQNKALRQVVQGVNRATRLVEQLLTLARLDPDTGFTNIRRFDLFIAAEDVLSNEAYLAIDKNIEISLAGTRGKFVAGNLDAIKVLMRNLIDNAIRYTPKNGIVEVSTDRRDDTVILTIADSGPGIPEQERSKVFNRFYRSLGTKESGSGLGLSIVTRIADLHHVDIELKTSKMNGLQIDVLFAAKDYDTI